MRPGHAVILCALALLSLGAVMVTSAGLTIGADSALSIGSLLRSRQTIYLLASALTLLLMSRLPLEWITRSLGNPIALLLAAGLLAGVCLLVYVPMLGVELNGARRWLGASIPGFGVVTIQPSEIAKWGLLIALGAYAASQGRKLQSFWPGLTPAIIAVGLLACLITLEDLGTATLIALTSAIVLLSAGARLVHFVALSPIAVLGLVAAVITRPYRLQRLTAFLDPFASPQDAGYHMIQSMVAISNGGGFGRGLGFGLQKFGYLPADESDFLFAVICEELGLAGASVVIFLYLTLLWSGWTIVRSERSQTLRLIGLGVISTVGLQALMNLMVVTGLGPTKGIALPLMSAGGTGWILTAGALGLLVAIDYRQAAQTLSASPEAEDEARTRSVDFEENEPLVEVIVRPGTARAMLDRQDALLRAVDE